MRKLLITGGSGFIGGHLSAIASSRWNVHVTYNSSRVPPKGSTKAHRLNIDRAEQVENLVDKLSPDVIIHLAAITDLGYCEENPQEAHWINVLGCDTLAAVADCFEARLIYASTDMVFKGDRSWYCEDDNADPVSVYGFTKLGGEQVVRNLVPNHCITRISLVYGFTLNASNCFTGTMIQELQHGRAVRLFEDEYRTPIYVENLCHVLLELAERDDLQGVYNVGGPDRLSRFQFGLKVCELLGFDRDLVVPVKVDDSSLPYPRPRDCSLNTDKAKSVLKTPIWNIEDGLKRMKELLG